MILNFCDPRLRPEIKCSAISMDGYEVTNLINDSRKGYLAYSCIKPPVHIDITFLCNISINHVLIWPSVGPQKSSGFQLYSRNTNNNSIPYTVLSSGFLSPDDAGVLFYSSDINSAEIPTPTNFLKRYMKVSLTKYVHVLRVTIYKTENSVPALGKIEVWGTVAPCCGKDIVASVQALWAKRPLISLSVTKLKTNNTPTDTRDNRLKIEANFRIPKSFLDPITWEIMTQPIILPSGNIIDQTTLEKYEENEKVWGRPLSDPFTGLRFTNERRCILATALKSRIDKFLLENSNQNEVKQLPRVLGHGPTVAGDRRIIEVPKFVLNRINNPLKRPAEDTKPNICKQMTADNNLQHAKRYCHKLPIAVVLQPSTAKIRVKPRQFTDILTSSKLAHNNSEINSNNDNPDVLVDDIFLDNNSQTLLPGIKRFSTLETMELHKISYKCECCSNSIFYRLPCKHVVCRKVLLSTKNRQCKSCSISYKSSEVERIHNILNK
ncbi:RING finger protein 37 [Monomorium pharaonis]|uniref:RING finger protein 37 n=1 Tax=Monomorium pharaonis TaxID=307658 RepID=UPI00063F2F1D|nr:RING finger protein 37 [Monomorium pharaonis]